MPVPQQIEAAKALLRRKLTHPEAVKYISYFQAYTNTYAPADYLRRIFSEAVAPADIVGLSVGTRPDALPPENLSVLRELALQKMLWVELGLQTIHENTASYIRRGYSLDCFEKAFYALKKIGAAVIVHVILGLPGETEEDMLATVQYLVDLKVDGIKLQLLHVLRGTDLERDFLAGKFEVLSMDEYVSVVRRCLTRIPPEIVVHRVTGDGPRSLLLAPMWSTDKKRILNRILRP